MEPDLTEETAPADPQEPIDAKTHEVVVRALFTSEGFPKGFFPSDTWPHGYPEGTITITVEQWREFLDNQGERRFVNGEVIPYTPPPPEPQPRSILVGTLNARLTDDEWDAVTERVSTERPRIRALWSDAAYRMTEGDTLWSVVVGFFEATYTPLRISQLLE